MFTLQSYKSSLVSPTCTNDTIIFLNISIKVNCFVKNKKHVEHLISGAHLCSLHKYS